MARREKKKASKPKQMWLVTFGDLVTLLLTFFVLLLSMASMDQSFITRVSIFTKDLGFLTYRGSGRVPTRIRHVIELMNRPEDVMIKANRIKDLLFPDEILPDDIDRQTLEENLEILQRPEGVALVVSDKLLFDSGSAEFAPGAAQLLSQVALMLMYVEGGVNVAGHTDSVGGRSQDNYELAGDRALNVLRYFLSQGMDPRRFSVAAYGPDFPVASNETPEGRAENRRVEVLVKTDSLLGGYS